MRNHVSRQSPNPLRHHAAGRQQFQTRGPQLILATSVSEPPARFSVSTQVGSLVGGYIMLRFFTPAVVAPDTNNIIQSKPTKIQRRNFVLVGFSRHMLTSTACDQWIKHKL